MARGSVVAACLCVCVFWRPLWFASGQGGVGRACLCLSSPAQTKHTNQRHACPIPTPTHPSLPLPPQTNITRKKTKKQKNATTTTTRRQHHNHTGLVGGDPDFHGGNPSFLSWFVRFMTTYSRPGQYARIVAWVFFLQALGAPYGNVVLFVAAAPIAAAFRLFYFGTYLPHLPPALAEGKEAGWRAGGKEGSAKEGQEEEAAAAAPLVGAARPSLWRRLAGPARDGSARMAWQLSHSADVPPLVAFLSCLCFGYHWEHHRFPYAPWFDLPKVRGLAREHGLRRRCVDAYLREAAGGEVAEQQRRALRGAGGEGVKAA